MLVDKWKVCKALWMCSFHILSTTFLSLGLCLKEESLHVYNNTEQVYWTITRLQHQIVLGFWHILQHQLDAIPAQFPSSDWTGRYKERVASPCNFPQIQQKVFYSAFFVSPIQTMCVCSIPSYTWLWFGLAKWISLSFFLWLLIIQILFWRRVQEGC